MVLSPGKDSLRREQVTMTNNSSPKRAPRGAANGGAEKPLKEKSSPGPAVNLVASGALPTWVPERDPLLEAKKKIDEQAVIQRVNRHLIPIFFVMTVGPFAAITPTRKSRTANVVSSGSLKGPRQWWGRKSHV